MERISTATGGLDILVCLNRHPQYLDFHLSQNQRLMSKLNVLVLDHKRRPLFSFISTA